MVEAATDPEERLGASSVLSGASFRFSVGAGRGCQWKVEAVE